MTVFLLLFRGVGGATQLPVARLRECLAGAGFRGVATYINSGNALVATDLQRDAVAAKVCTEAFGFRKAIYALTREEWAELIAANPFPDFAEGKSLHAAVLAEEPEQTRVEALRALCGPREGIAVVGRVAFLHTPGGFGTSRLAAAFDRGIGVANTARNWNTVRKLVAMTEAMGDG